MCCNAKRVANNVEYKSMDATANPYIALAAIITAGLLVRAPCFGSPVLCCLLLPRRLQCCHCICTVILVPDGEHVASRSTLASAAPCNAAAW